MEVGGCVGGEATDVVDVPCLYRGCDPCLYHGRDPYLYRGRRDHLHSRVRRRHHRRGRNYQGSLGVEGIGAAEEVRSGCGGLDLGSQVRLWGGGGRR